MCTISIFSLMLAVRCLWDPAWAEVKQSNNPDIEMAGRAE